MGQVMIMALICLLLFIGTFICGYLPSLIKASSKVLNLIAIFGSATIIGAALIIILPESAMILINSQYKLNKLNGVVVNDDEIVDEHLASTIGSAVMLGFGLMLVLTETFVIIQEKAALKEKESSPEQVGNVPQTIDEKTKLLNKESETVEDEKDIAKDVRSS